jgi:hypothetical protein
MWLRLTRVLLVGVSLVAIGQAAVGQEPPQQRIDELSQRVAQLESRPLTERIIEHREASGLVVFLYGVFCALWAQNTHRNPWLWFFLGLIFNVITVLVLLSKNAEDRRAPRERGAA